MKLNAYAIYDQLAEAWGNPFFLNPKIASRTFAAMKEDTPKRERQDKVIYHVGTWDNETGKAETNEEAIPVYILGEQEDKE